MRAQERTETSEPIKGCPGTYNGLPCRAISEGWSSDSKRCLGDSRAQGASRVQATHGCPEGLPLTTLQSWPHLRSGVRD